MKPKAIRAMWMRGGSSKGLFFLTEDLPSDVAERDAVLLRVMGSPDPYGTQIDGLGGATPSTSKVVLVERSKREGCDVEYLFGAVAIDRSFIDWSGNCGNLSAAVGPFAIFRGLLAPQQGDSTMVRLWQANIGQRIDAHVPLRGGQPLETGEFELDGVPFASAEIRLEFLESAAPQETPTAIFPTNAVREALEVPGVGRVHATLTNAGAPTVFVEAEAFGLNGTESRAELELNTGATAALQKVRRHAAVLMGLCPRAEDADLLSPHAPRIAFVAPAAAYVSSAGKTVEAGSIDLVVRILSQGRLHHAMTGTGAVAIAVAAAVPGTVIARALNGRDSASSVHFGHPSGTLVAGATIHRRSDGSLFAERVLVSRSARRLMDGQVFG
ncbi:2-methylaconitate cis-trans isomerase PrpF [Variovorax sp. J31P207]|uniref:2-methylaconitate cis-trans isomerase PrpF n=1 Tax=Variovorax sp. J31P207 TaxID=3053510 RepID=UPI002575FC02|nr:2-methylaconitate cis-trans isomerase PrpF [Variovorax sp. J31P207]MDM0072489.1 2-methylaconitate cis-trans isomerase PrpF [Variovorax sp. J31P207]